MSKEQMAKRKEEVLAAIKDPVVREHYRSQLDMAEELEAEGIPTAFHDSDMFVEERKEIEREAETRIAAAVAGELQKGAISVPLWLIVVIMTLIAAYAAWSWL